MNKSAIILIAVLSGFVGSIAFSVGSSVVNGLLADNIEFEKRPPTEEEPVLDYSGCVYAQVSVAHKQSGSPATQDFMFLTAPYNGKKKLEKPEILAILKKRFPATFKSITSVEAAGMCSSGLPEDSTQ